MAQQLLHGLHGDACRHGHQRDALPRPQPAAKGLPDLVQRRLQHLRLHRQKDRPAARRDLPVVSRPDAQLLCQALRLGGRMIGDQDVCGPLPHGADQGRSHIARADESKLHGLFHCRYLLICPLPVMMYLYVVSSRRPMGPRAWSFWVEMPISQPRPNSPPSVKRVEAFT